MLKIAISGTRKGFNPRQMDKFIDLMKWFNVISEFHHGDCVGVDQLAHNWVREFMPPVKIIIHPPEDSTYRAFCAGYHEMRPPFKYIRRNRLMVDEVTDVIIVPDGIVELQRGSGTWATRRYAIKTQTRMYHLSPEQG